jgi:hypothetical protein
MPYAPSYLDSPMYQQWLAMQQANQQQNLRTPASTLANILTSGINTYGMKKARTAYDAKEAQKASLLASLLAPNAPPEGVNVTPPIDYNSQTPGPEQVNQRAAAGTYPQSTSYAPDTTQMMARLLAGSGTEAGSELTNQLAPTFLQSYLSQQEKANEPLTQYQKANLGLEGRKVDLAAQQATPEFAGKKAAAEAAANYPFQSALKSTPGAPEPPKSSERQAQDIAAEQARQAGQREPIAEAAARAAAIEKAKMDAQNAAFGATGAGANTPQVNGEDFLATLNPTIASQVKALADGRMEFPKSFALKSPYWQQMIGLVSQYDPSFDAVNYGNRAKTRGDFTAGKSAQNIRALNTAIGHLDTLSGQISGTASTFSPALNSVLNFGAQQIGKAGPTNFAQTASALSTELTSVFRGSGGAEADVKRYLSQLSGNASAEQKSAAVQNITDLLDSRLNALGDQYTQGMGKTIDPLQLLEPKAQEAYQRLHGKPGTSARTGIPGQTPPPPPSQQAPAPQGAPLTAVGPNGERIQWNGSAWVPVR